MEQICSQKHEIELKMSKELRDEVASVVKRTQLGPYWGENEILLFSPTSLYTTGILSPKETTDEEDDKINESSNYDELSLTTQYKPSAIGITSILSSGVKKITIDINFGRYVEETVDSIKKWKRIPYHAQFKLIVSPEEIKVSSEDGKINKEDESRAQFTVFDNLDIYITKKKLTRSQGMISLTVSIVNSDKQVRQTSSLIFQPTIQLLSDNPVFNSFEFPDGEIYPKTKEAINKALLYRNYTAFASGHGCSVNWEKPNIEGRSTSKIFTEIIPDLNLNGNDFNSIESDVLYMKRLAGESYHSSKERSVKKDVIISELKEFIGHYEKWIEEDQKVKVKNLQGISNFAKDDQALMLDCAQENIDECEKLLSRMDKGIELLETDPMIFEAFVLANRAMFMQRAMNESIKREKNNKEKDVLTPGIDDYKVPDFKETFIYNDNNDGFLAKWRPFQLAFLLSQLPGLTDETSSDRELVDLIWFTTGGGKTEAYLGVLAFSILYRRLKAKKQFNDPDKGAGVTCIMRYTLRLLNLQQFGRAATLICSLELMRRQLESKLGKKNIGIGIWVGSSLTPNSWGSNADREYNKRNGSSFFPSLYALMHGKKPKFRLPISECPLCGMHLESQESLGITGKSHKGDSLRNEPFHMFCPNSMCSFFITDDERKNLNVILKKRLPVFFVDEQIYKEFPSLIIATADKFASLAWNSNCFNIFNIELVENDATRVYNAPDLIIQDELHLINASLGTIYGVYELAIDQLTKQEGHKPKIIAATATANNSEYQCKVLFNRTMFAQFPPFGIDIDDSFFSKKKKIDSSARKYIGIQPYGVTSTVGQIRLVSVLQTLVPSLPFSNNELDKYYTNLIYFNTKRELGKFRTLLEDDIKDNMEVLSQYFNVMSFGYREELIKELSGDTDPDDIRSYLSILETSKLPSNFKEIALTRYGIRRSEDIQYLLDLKIEKTRTGPGGAFLEIFNNKELFENLEIPFEEDLSYEALFKNLKVFKEKIQTYKLNESDVPQTVPATSMISVGIDIPRFNIMQVTGQPKTHADYIQTSSRVGRRDPGLVITTFNPAYNRDRSHFEQFIDYHQAYYKHVEPTTVTPFSKEALDKALPAVIFILMKFKHFGSLKEARLNDKAKSILFSLFDDLKLSVSGTLNSLHESSLNEEEKKDYMENFEYSLKTVFERWHELSDKINDLSFPSYKTQNNKDEIGSHIFLNPIYDQKEYKHQFKCMNNIRSVEQNVKLKLLPREF
tara:strand:- start:143570 stop:147298 length:3729 start_codon:yes stop_codon:yes gene_type:complete